MKTENRKIIVLFPDSFVYYLVITYLILILLLNLSLENLIHYAFYILTSLLLDEILLVYWIWSIEIIFYKQSYFVG